MARYRRRLRFQPLLLLLTMPVVLAGVSYALFSQQLSVTGKSRAVVHASTVAPALTLTATRSQWTNGPSYTYVVNAAIANSTQQATIDWQAVVQLPAEISSLSCWNVECSLTGTTLRLSSMPYNGALSAGGATSFGMSFSARSAAITFANYTATGATSESSLALAAVVPGLSAQTRRSNTWQANSATMQQYDVIVTNASTQRIASWYVEFGTSGTVKVTSIWNATYLAQPGLIRFTGPNRLEPGQTAQFGMQVQVPSSSWTPNVTTKGRL